MLGLWTCCTILSLNFPLLNEIPVTQGPSEFSMASGSGGLSANICFQLRPHSEVLDLGPEHIFLRSTSQSTIEVTGNIESCFCGKMNDDQSLLTRGREVTQGKTMLPRNLAV